MAEKLTSHVFAKWDAKLSNWALYFGGPRGAPKDRPAPVSDAYEDLANWRDYATDFKRRDAKAKPLGATWESDEPPGIRIDAIDTDALVMLLPDELYDAVDAFWHMTGPMEYRASALRVHLATLYRRRDLAVLTLEMMDLARRAGAGRQSTDNRKESASGVVVRRSRYVPDDWAT